MSALKFNLNYDGLRMFCLKLICEKEEPFLPSIKNASLIQRFKAKADVVCWKKNKSFC
jgi:hypothetical protein